MKVAEAMTASVRAIGENTRVQGAYLEMHLHYRSIRRTDTIDCSAMLGKNFIVGYYH